MARQGEHAPRAWVLNLDAEHELEAPRGYQPTDALRAIVAAQSRRLLGALVRPGDIVLDDGDLVGGARRAQGLRGAAWLPTPRALRILEAAGAVGCESPGLDVLQRVNRRDFAARLRDSFREDAFEKHVVHDLDAALAILARPTRLGWLARRAFGAAGRGRRKLHPGRPDEAERAWLVASLRLGPMVIEPWQEVAREHTRSGWVRPDGGVVVSAPCFQRVEKSGAWIGTERAEAGELSKEIDNRLAHALESAGRALAAEGYRGPFGIDAWTYREDGREVLNPLSEINARFTMDWATAMVHDPRDGAARRLHDELDR
jgi:hypothetical protein